jgi:hypothetical protein
MRAELTRRRAVRAFAALAVLAGIMSFTVPSSANHLLSPSSFNAGDGNQIDDGATETDWENFLPNTTADNLFIGRETGSGSSDNSLAGGTKDDTECASTTTGSIPPNKDDLLRFYLYHETLPVPVGSTTNTDTFLYLGYVRALPGSTTASAHGVFELNKLDVKCPGTSDFYVRTAGDVRLAFDDEGGDQPIISAQIWQEPCPGNKGNDLSGCWTAKTPLDAHIAEGSFNEGNIQDRLLTDTGSTTQIGPEQFAEMKINMDAAGLLSSGSCVGFGAAGLFTGSSGNSDKEQSKDYIAPVPINITNCGSVQITKTFSAGTTPATPAVFAVRTDAAPTGGTIGAGDDFFTYSDFSTLSSGITAAATSMTVADGSKYPASGPFYVLVDSEIIKVGSRSGNTLSGLVRSIGAPAAALHNAGAAVKRMGACDISTSGGTCSITNLPFGSYWAEAGYTGGPPQTFALSAGTPTASLTFNNQANPVDVTVRKQDDALNPIVICADAGAPTQPCADFQLYKDGGASASTTITTVGGINSSATSVAVADATVFGTAPFKVIVDAEILNVTASTTNSLTVQRAQLNTTAAAHSAGATVTKLTLDKECNKTATTGECTFASVQPSASYWIVESVAPTGYGQDTTLPKKITVNLGDAASAHVYTFTNPRLFKVITFVCGVFDGQLYESGIVYDSTTIGTDKTPTSFVDATTETAICGASGGYVHNNVGTGDHTSKVNIP